MCARSVVAFASALASRARREAASSRVDVACMRRQPSASIQEVRWLAATSGIRSRGAGASSPKAVAQGQRQGQWQFEAGRQHQASATQSRGWREGPRAVATREGLGRPGVGGCFGCGADGRRHRTAAGGSEGVGAREHRL